MVTQIDFRISDSELSKKNVKQGNPVSDQSLAEVQPESLEVVQAEPLAVVQLLRP